MADEIIKTAVVFGLRYRSGARRLINVEGPLTRERKRALAREHDVENIMACRPRRRGKAMAVRRVHFFLDVKIDGDSHTIWIERDVRRAFRVLNGSARDAMQATLPGEIQVVQTTGRKGTVYYRVAQEDMDAWIQAASDTEEDLANRLTNSRCWREMRKAMVDAEDASDAQERLEDLMEAYEVGDGEYNLDGDVWTLKGQVAGSALRVEVDRSAA